MYKNARLAKQNAWQGLGGPESGHPTQRHSHSYLPSTSSAASGLEGLRGEMMKNGHLGTLKKSQENDEHIGPF